MRQDDQATEVEALHREAAIKFREPELKAKGQCYNCEEPLKDGCYCDGDCRDDHEKREQLYARKRPKQL